MKKILILFTILSIIVITVIGQTTQIKYKEKYFYYMTNDEVKSILAAPLFATDYREKKDVVYFEVYNKTERFLMKFNKEIMSVLKKYYTIEEIREMSQENSKRAAAQLIIQFDYYGNIKYICFVFEKRLRKILTDEKLYALYQEFSNLKYDTSTLEWNRLEPQDEKKAYTMKALYFFNEHTYPES